MIYLILFLNIANAANWMRVDDIKAGLKRGFELKESCEVGTLDEKIEIDSPCPTESEPDAICKIKVPKNLKPIACPTEKEPDAICEVNVACVEIGVIAPDIVGVDESKTPPEAIIDPAKKTIKDQKEAQAAAKKAAQEQALANLKAAPPVIPANQMSAMIHNLLEVLGVK